MPVLLWWVLAAAAQDDEATREAELFGSDEASREAELFGTDEASREEDIFGEEPSAPEAASSILDKIAEQDDTLAIGGQLWLQLTGQLDTHTVGPDGVALSSPNLLDLFVDARPNDRVRAFARGRLLHDWTRPVDPGEGTPFAPAEPQSEVLLDQLWIKFDVARKVYTTVGKQPIRWGAGRFWNPTDFLNRQRLDPLAVLDLRNGASLVKVHVPFEAAGANAYVIANLDQAAALDEIGGAGRLEWLLGQTEVSVSAAARKDQPIRLGGDLSSGISVLDVRAEGAVLHGHADPRWEGSFDYTVLPPEVPTELDVDDEWIFQGVVGADLTARYNAQDTVSLGVEYFFNGAGYDDAELYEWLLLNGGFTPLYLGRDYLGTYAMLPGPGRWDDHTFIASWLTNLSDRSSLARLDYRGGWLTWLDVNVFVARSLGPHGELHYGLDLPAMPEALAAGCALDPECAPYLEMLAAPIVVPAPTWSAGAGVAVRF